MKAKLIGIILITFLAYGCAGSKLQKYNKEVEYYEVKPPEEYFSDQYPEPDTYAKYPGGQPGLQNYISSKTRYPIKAVRRGIFGEVEITFVVGKDGRTSNMEVIKSPSKYHTKMYEDMIEDMYRWEAAIKGGEPVEQRYVLKAKFVEFEELQKMYESN